jgi:glycosyltransferase involved in cell wall biosynthesis
MNKESILFLTGAYPDFDSSYRGIFIKNLVIRLKEEGYQVFVVTPKIYKKSSLYEEQNGIRIYRFPFFSENRPLIQYKKIPYSRMILYYIIGSLVTLYVALKNQCGLIHAHWAVPIGLIGAVTGLLVHKPLIVTIHGSDQRMAAERSVFFRRIFLFVCSRAKHVHCVSNSMKEEIEKWGIDEGKISVFPMAVDDSFLQAGKNRKFGEKDEPLTVISNRNLHSLYNVSLFVRSIPHVIEKDSRWRFLIAGEGPERVDLENQAKDLSISPYITFLGRIPHEEMACLLGSADIYVSTSTSDGTSVSLLEAMASGAFPIVTNIGSNQRWISDGENGFLVPLEDEVFLAEKIIEASQNMDLRKEATRKNMEIITECAEEKRNTSRMIGIYEKAFH